MASSGLALLSLAEEVADHLAEGAKPAVGGGEELSELLYDFSPFEMRSPRGQAADRKGGTHQSLSLQWQGYSPWHGDLAPSVNVRRHRNQVRGRGRSPESACAILNWDCAKDPDQDPAHRA